MSTDENAAAAPTATLVFSDILGPSERVHQGRSVSLDEWLGRGIDSWVWSTLEAFRAMLRSGTRSTETVRVQCGLMKTFFAFVTKEVPSAHLGEPRRLRPAHVAQYAAWLQREAPEHGWTIDTVRVKYQSFKAVVRQMVSLGLVQEDMRRLFPPRALPNGNREAAGQQALSDGEEHRLAQAIKADLADLHHARLQLNASEVIANRFLIVAMRTGSNLTPLLEMQRDALRPGLLPGTMRLRTVKHRGHKILERALLRGSEVEQPILIPTDAVAVLERTLADTQDLLEDASPSLRARVWLYRSLRSQDYGQVAGLTYSVVSLSIERLIERRDLRADDGSPLKVNVSRLRKSFAKRAFRLSGADVVTTARMLGNTPRVADMNYLRVDDQLKAESAAYMESELVARLRGDEENPPQSIVIASSDTSEVEKTPVGGCRDTLYGGHAPKNGSHCDLFVMCLFCPSFAVVGEEEDLWRLYSYQIFAQRELSRLQQRLAMNPGDAMTQRFLELYSQAIPFIDQLVPRSFGKARAERAKQRAHAHLHPFWAHQLHRVANVRGNAVDDGTEEQA